MTNPAEAGTISPRTFECLLDNVEGVDRRYVDQGAGYRCATNSFDGADVLHRERATVHDRDPGQQRSGAGGHKLHRSRSVTVETVQPRCGAKTCDPGGIGPVGRNHQSLLPRVGGSDNDEYAGCGLAKISRADVPGHDILGEPELGSLLSGYHAVTRSCKLAYGTPWGADEHSGTLSACSLFHDREQQGTVTVPTRSTSRSTGRSGRLCIMSAAEIRQRTAHVNGIDLQLLEAGDPAQETVILSHGFPEGAYSWRHQLPALAAAGYHVIAPDQRGYGHSSAPSDVSSYGIRHLTDDLNALLDEAGKEQAVFVGHDWGSMIVWEHARMYPERVKAVVGVSVPLVQWPAPPIQMLRTVFGENFFYMVYFQDVGPAESELGADPGNTMGKILWGASGEGFALPTGMRPAVGTGFLTNMPTPPALPWSWLSAKELRHYAAQFEHSGFFGPVSYYRNMDANYEVTKDLSFDRIAMPSFFIGGANDPVLVMDPSGLERMSNVLTDYRGSVMIEGCGHWTQQEKPDQFNEALIGFLHQL